MKRILITTLFAACIVAPAWADVEKGAAAYKRGDFAAAHREFHDDAAKGDPRAQFSLGLLYLRGQGVTTDPTTGVKWLRKAANGGDGEARMVLGHMYRHGQSVPRDYVKSYMWLTLALGRIRGPKRKVAYGLRSDVAAKMTANEIAQAKKLARQWKKIGR